MTLETYDDPDDLFLARSSDVNAVRPLFTGDVIEGILIPGFTEPGKAAIVAHPCSIRGAGGSISGRVMMAIVGPHQSIPANAWRTRYFDRAPLPKLDMSSDMFVIRFDSIGLVRAEDINLKQRMACLSQFGINLLQQRFIHHLTRFVVPTWQLQQAFSHTFDEAELLENWNDTLTTSGVLLEDSEERFEKFIRSPSEGMSFQEQLQNSQLRAFVRAACRREAARQISGDQS